MAWKTGLIWIVFSIFIYENQSSPGNGDESSGDEGRQPKFQEFVDVASKIEQSEQRSNELKFGEQLRQYHSAHSSIQEPWENTQEMYEKMSAMSQDRSLPIEVQGFHSHVIIVIGSDEIVNLAGQRLFEKTQDSSGAKKILLQWNKNTETFSRISGSTNVELSDLSKLTIVGHGSRESEITLGELSSSDLAHVILRLYENNSPLHFSSKYIKALSLVACNIGSKRKGDAFLRDFLVTLDNQGLRTGSLSARTADVTVRPDGRKETQLDTGYWLQHEPGHKRIVKLGQNKQLVDIPRLSESTGEQRSEDQNSHEYFNLLGRNDLFYAFEGDEYYTLDANIFDDFLKEHTGAYFNIQSEENTVMKELHNVYVFNRPGEQEKILLRNIRGMDGLKENIKEITEESLELRREAINNKVTDLSHHGITIGDKTVKDVWERILNNENANNIEESITNQLNNKLAFFQCGKFVLKMDYDAFYATPYGMTEPITETMINKYSEKYRDMGNMRYNNQFIEMAKLWVEGRHEDLTRDFPEMNGYDAMAVFATHFSEVLRNRNMLIINRLLWDLAPSWNRFQRLHPMTGQGTWSHNHCAIGPDYVPTREVGQDARKIIRTWLSNVELVNRRLFFSSERTNRQGKKKVEGNTDIMERFKTIIAPIIPTVSFDTPTGVTFKSQLKLRKDALDKAYKEEKSLQRRCLRPKLTLKMAEDKFSLENKLQMIIEMQSKADNVDYQILQHSIETNGNGLIVKLQSTSELPTKKEIWIEKETELRTKEFLDDHFDGIDGSSEMESGKTTKINHALGIYGTLMGLQAARDFFKAGRKVEGGIALAQSAHGVGELTGINEAVSGFVQKSANQAMTKIAESLEGKTTEKVAGHFAELGEVASHVPALSFAFTAFNIYEDVKQGNALGYTDAALDSAILLTSLAGPELEPVALALTIVRLGIDSFYYEIKHELDSLPPSASGGQRFVAVLKGAVFALKDIAKTTLDIVSEFSMLSLAYKIPELDERHRKDMALIEELRNPDNYFKLMEERDEDGCHSILDFASGKDSSLGGAMYVELSDDNCVYIEIEDPIQSTRRNKKTCFPDKCTVNDIVLGVGETHKIKLTKKTVTLLFFIPIHTQEIIGNMREDSTTLHGTYKGNSASNRFYAVQKLPDGFKYDISNYFYNLYGQNGSDTFYLGPQITYVQGGNGQDLYFIPTSGGITSINNHAEDRAIDLMVINAPLIDIFAKKEEDNLKIVCKNSHQVTISNWFLGEEYRHMKFKTSEQTMFQIGKIRLDQYVQLEIVGLDYSQETMGKSIDLRNPPFMSVISLTGSPYDDTFFGNDLSNILAGGKGNDYLEGGNGRDIYIVEADNSCDTINNVASDGEIDIIKVNADSENFKVQLINHIDIKIWDESSANKTCVIVKGWKRGSDWQHFLFMTKDFFTFYISNTTSVPEIVGLIKDFTDSPTGVDFDLSTLPGNEKIMTVIGSPYKDRIYGNDKTNFISGNNGDYLSARGGKDTYVVQCNEANPDVITLNNFDGNKDLDFLLLPAEFDSFRFSSSDCSAVGEKEKSLIIYNQRQECQIILESWFKSEEWQHMAFHTKDGITFTIPQKKCGTITPLVFAVDKSSSEQQHNTIDLRDGALSSAIKVIGSPGYDTIYGNDKDNYFDPGNGGAFIQGSNGSDTYVLTGKHNESYRIDNCAKDSKIDIILLSLKLKALSVQKDRADAVLLESGKEMLRLHSYHSHSECQHLVLKSSDGIWFWVSDKKPSIHPLYIDMKELHLQHLNLSIHEYSSVLSVHGERQHSNFIYGNKMNNSLIGGNEADIIEGLEGDDLLQGAGGEDYLSGGPGSDEVHGGDGTDWILGGDGDDIIYPGPGSDRIHGGSGSDTLLFAGDHKIHSGVLVNLNIGFGVGADADGDLYFSIENVMGTSYADVLIGDENDNILGGDSGDDLIIPLDGNDFLSGGSGSDIYYLAGAIGMKIIDNFSKDQKLDLIRLQGVNVKDLMAEKSCNDLVVYIEPKEQVSLLGPIIIKNWYKGDWYRHILIHLDQLYCIM
ncbi:uncharacterized protein LOC106706858 [Latimeria chalumnae]|uniref:uncharacterized protein LOC106706858 n=1 Tax=Latimeria chalumnae TaxID=7897 RepID=UPI0006D90EB4|nr:PREDICTED: uncharacterized protein LOC106706858 [Latimeria chalumnae]XP_014353852.1 PREDICTED: uncharacterized protein LOC106706858 [Latimeria chalumnae]|eukprot:XP_014353851.1 PREDICTED: uncharacterized protein LOC106706858 [Latimeria chalumnae]